MFRRGLASLLFLVLSLFVLPRMAHADQPGPHTVPVAVLTFDSEDAPDQADAITGALRSRIRAAQGWSLIETTQSLGMMTTALRCSTRPSEECQAKISDQIKSERFIYGYVSKGPTPGAVTTEVHFYQKGKEDTVIKETYAENLKDANDDTLGKIAGRIIERLGGTAVGVVIVRTDGDAAGEIIIDGEKRLPMEKGGTRVELAAGSHAVEVSLEGAPVMKRNVVVTAGRETVLEFQEPEGAKAAGGRGVSTRKVIGGISMGVGVALEAVAVIELVRYLDIQSTGVKNIAPAELIDQTSPPGSAPRPCREYSNKCREIDNDSKTASGLAIGAAALGGVALVTGAILFFGGSDQGSEQSTPAARTKPKLVPLLGTTNGLSVVGQF